MDAIFKDGKILANISDGLGCNITNLKIYIYIYILDFTNIIKMQCSSDGIYGNAINVDRSAVKKYLILDCIYY